MEIYEFLDLFSLFCYSTVAPPGQDFIFIKVISHVTFIILANQIVILSLLIPTKLTITKVHHLIRLRFEWSEHKKSQCELWGCYRGWASLCQNTGKIDIQHQFSMSKIIQILNLIFSVEEYLTRRTTFNHFWLPP